MDSSSNACSCKEKGLSTEGVAAASFHIVKPTPSPNSASLVSHKKKVGQSLASRCENPHGMHFICKHGHPIYRTLPCHARFAVDCPACAEEWREKTEKRYSKIIQKMKNPKLVTLTLKKGGKHELKELPQLVHRFRKYLRRKGYDIGKFVSCIEPPNHVHCVWDCNYVPQKLMSDVWDTVTKDSFVVDIRKIKPFDEYFNEKMDKKLRKRGVAEELRREIIDKKLRKINMRSRVSEQCIDEQRWRVGVKYITKYITKISGQGTAVKFQGVHVIISWGGGEESKKYRMVCKTCGAYFAPLWYCGQVSDYENDAVEFVEIDNDFG